jgi:hypothetical protein
VVAGQELLGLDNHGALDAAPGDRTFDGPVLVDDQHRPFG